MGKFDFNPKHYSDKLIPLLQTIAKENQLTAKKYHQLIKLFPKTANSLFSKAEIIAGFRHFQHTNKLKAFSKSLEQKLQAKPVRTISGVVPATLLTKPYPCPGKCIFCPNDSNMPKSYLSSEPGAQRAAMNHFDPYNQITTRLITYHANGHSTGKVELIVLGGTWSSYPVGYKIWFIKRCFDALNDFTPQTVPDKLSPPQITGEATWEELKMAQDKNETASSRAVGLSLETRPDFINPQELIRFRKLGCTKVQIGIQSLNNKVLALNKRGHTIKETKSSIKLLRQFGFKIQGHWMANLYGSSPQMDKQDFTKLYADYHYRPDELKLYPTALIASAELMHYYQKGLWVPYSESQLLDVLVACLPQVPSYCRVTRIIRDFSSDDIVDGNKKTNFRQIVEAKIIQNGQTIKEIRFNEVRLKPTSAAKLQLKVITYQTSIGKEKFIYYQTQDRKIAGFLRLSLPRTLAPIDELKGSALIREIHVYGQALELGSTRQKSSQHLGLGKQLILKAKALARVSHFAKLSVISAIGTREYYRHQGFFDGELYQHLK